MNHTIKHKKEDRIWFISDLHLGHNKSFLYEPRGFKSIDEMNEQIIKNLKACVEKNDYLYICGDLTLGPIEKAEQWLRQIPGKVHVIAGNHDTDARLEFYEKLGFKVSFGARIRLDKYRLFLSHYPTFTANPGEDKLTLATINIYGHTHQNFHWCSDNPFAFCVCPEANNNYPLEAFEIINLIKSNLKLKELGYLN